MPVYCYTFNGNFSNITPRYWLGAMHSCESFQFHPAYRSQRQTDARSSVAEIPLVFGTHYQFRGNSTELEWQTSYSMEGKCWTSMPFELCAWAMADDGRQPSGYRSRKMRQQIRLTTRAWLGRSIRDLRARSCSLEMVRLRRSALWWKQGLWPSL